MHAAIRRSARFAVALALLATAGVRDASAIKKSGFDDPDAGTGMFLFESEKATIRWALAKMMGTIVTTKDGIYSADAIARDLEAMIRSGRLGKGYGAAADNFGMTLSDGEPSTSGDRMNIADHLLASENNELIANTLFHEWLHATQGRTGTEAEDEAPAYQLGLQVFLDKGGLATDAMAESDAERIAKYKHEINGEVPVVPDSKVPEEGDEREQDPWGNEYSMFQSPGRLYAWDGTAWIDSVVALPGQQYFTMIGFPSPPNLDRLLIFGTDRSVPSNPVGTLTVVDAGPGGFTSRTDLTLPGLRYPFSVSRDPVSGKLYLLDAHVAGPGIVTLVDLNADHVPDAMQPFAPRGFAGVDSAEAVTWATIPGLGAGLALDELDARADDARSQVETLVFLRDLDLDGLADTFSSIREADLASFAPTFATDPRPGHTSVQVFAMPGHTIHVVRTDANGDADFGLVGTGIAPLTGEPRWIPVAPPLERNQYLKAVDVTDDTQAQFPTLVRIEVPGTTDAVLALAALFMLLVGIARLKRSREPAEA